VYKAATRTVDFPVYYRTAQTMLNGSGPLYGPRSGLGWPNYYRYPPFFLLVFAPFALLPLKAAAALWAMLQFAVLYWLARALAERIDFPGGAWWFFPFCVTAALLIQEIRYGNAQFLIFALTAAALLLLDERPLLAASLLALAISLKVWPLFFVPYLAARRRLKVPFLAVAFSILLATVPALVFGWHGNLHLLHTWAAQEFGTATRAGSIWFPSQSLRGVMTRYLSYVPEAATGGYYPHVNFLSLSTSLIGKIWIVLDVLGYLALLLLAFRARTPGCRTCDAFAFCALPLLEPFTHRVALVVLLFPAMVAATDLAGRAVLSVWARRALYVSAAIFFLEPLVPGALSQRFFQAVGVDFFAYCLLAGGLASALVREGRFPSPGNDVPAAITSPIFPRAH
jgi:Glycosyltransferase family 87